MLPFNMNVLEEIQIQMEIYAIKILKIVMNLKKKLIKINIMKLKLPKVLIYKI